MKKRFVPGQLSAYPDLLNRYLVAKIQTTVYKAPPFLLLATRTDAASSSCDMNLTTAPSDGDAQAKLKRCRFSLSEQIIWTEPLRGIIPLTEMEAADKLAIGGLSNTAERVERSHMVFEFGKASAPPFVNFFTTTPRNTQLQALLMRHG